MPTQLKGRTIVNGSPYCSWAPRAKYSVASFWKPYVERGGGLVSWAPSGVGNTDVDSNTMLLDSTVIFCSRPNRKALSAASKVAAQIRSFSASRSYANSWKYEMPPIIAAPAKIGRAHV